MVRTDSRPDAARNVGAISSRRKLSVQQIKVAVWKELKIRKTRG
jgi:hypothetical protein